MIGVLGVQGLAGDSAQLSQSGDGWRGRQGLALDFSEGALEVRRVWIGVDGAIEVIGEAADAPMEPSQHEEGGTPVDGIEQIRRERIDLGEGYEVPWRQGEIVNDAAEGGGKAAFGIGTEMPVPGSSGDGVAGGAADSDGCRPGFAEGQVGAGTVKIAEAVELVVFDGSDGGFSSMLTGIHRIYRIICWPNGVGTHPSTRQRRTFRRMSGH